MSKHSVFSRVPAVVLLVPMLLLPSRSLPAAETLLLRDGQKKEAPLFLFENAAFTVIGEPVSVPRQQVADWWFGNPTGSSVPAAAPATDDPAATRRLQEYRQLAQAMAARYPGCKGVQVLDDGDYRLTADHRHVYRYHFAGLILNEELLDWGSLNLGFTEGRSRVRILEARCLTRDGRLFTFDPATAKIAKPGGGDVFFNTNLKQLNATLPGVEVGAVVEYRFESEEYAPEDWRLFFPSFSFQGDVPVCRSVFTVAVPDGVPLYSWVENWAVAGTGRRGSVPWFPFLKARPYRTGRETVDNVLYQTYVWEKKDIPPVVEEPNMPPLNEVTPAMYGTIQRDWQPLNTLVGGMQRERLVSSPEIESKVRELIRDCPTVDDRAARIYHWAQKNIRYISIKSSLSSGWSGHPAPETFRNGYGDCTDKSILLAVMLRCAGIEAEPVILRTNDAGLLFPPYPYIFGNHCITEIHLDGADRFLDSTTQDHRYPALRADDHGVLALNFITGIRRTIPVPPGLEANGKISTEEMVLAVDGSLKVKSRNRYAGMYEAGLRSGWKQVPEELRPQLMQQYVNGIAPNARLVDFTMSDPQNLDLPFVLEYEFLLPDYAIKAGKLRIFQFPQREKQFPETSLEKRRYPVVYTTSEAWERTTVLQLPKSFRLLSLPEPVQFRDTTGRYHETFTVSGRTIEAAIGFERYDRRIPKKAYPGYRKLLQQIEAATRKPMYLETE